MKKMIIKIIRFYQIIPFKSHKMCRYYPTCSEYMIIALEEYGLFKGLYLGIKRIIRCNPFGGFGYDPVIKEGKKNEKIFKKFISN